MSDRGWSHQPFNQPDSLPEDQPEPSSTTSNVSYEPQYMRVHRPDYDGLKVIAEYLPHELESLVRARLDGELLSAFDGSLCSVAGERNPNARKSRVLGYRPESSPKPK